MDVYICVMCILVSHVYYDPVSTVSYSTYMDLYICVMCILCIILCISCILFVVIHRIPFNLHECIVYICVMCILCISHILFICIHCIPFNLHRCIHMCNVYPLYLMYSICMYPPYPIQPTLMYTYV